jgi:hypothetical protein
MSEGKEYIVIQLKYNESLISVSLLCLVLSDIQECLMFVSLLCIVLSDIQESLMSVSLLCLVLSDISGMSHDCLYAMRVLTDISEEYIKFVCVLCSFSNMRPEYQGKLYLLCEPRLPRALRWYWFLPTDHQQGAS